METKEIIIKFFELKAKQLICKIWVATNQKPGYVNDEVDLMMKVLKVQNKLEELEKELYEFIVKNELVLKDANLNELANQPEYKVSFDKQKEYSKELLGYETTIEDLLERYSKKY